MIRFLYIKYGIALIIEGIIVIVTLGYWKPTIALNSAKNIARYKHNKKG